MWQFVNPTLLYISSFFLDRIINLLKITTNDTVSGQQKTDSTTPLEVRPVDGYPDDNPKTTFGVKKVPLDLVPPSVEHALAEAFSLGAKKYGPYNWREKRVSSSVYYAAALRHAKAWWDGEDIDPESGFSHLSHILACFGIIVDAKSVGNLNDNRPPKGAAARLQQEWSKKHE